MKNINRWNLIKRGFIRTWNSKNTELSYTSKIKQNR